LGRLSLSTRKIPEGEAAPPFQILPEKPEKVYPYISGLMFQPWSWKGEKLEPAFPFPLLGFVMALLLSGFSSVGAWYLAKETIKKRR